MAKFADSRVKIFPLLFFPHLFSVLNPLPTFPIFFPTRKKKKVEESFLLAHAPQFLSQDSRDKKHSSPLTPP